MSKAKEPLSQRHKVTETQEDLRLNHEGHEVHEGGAGFTTNFRRGAENSRQGNEGIEGLVKNAQDFARWSLSDPTVLPCDSAP